MRLPKHLPPNVTFTVEPRKTSTRSWRLADKNLTLQLLEKGAEVSLPPLSKSMLARAVWHDLLKQGKSLVIKEVDQPHRLAYKIRLWLDKNKQQWPVLKQAVIMTSSKEQVVQVYFEHWQMEEGKDGK